MGPPAGVGHEHLERLAAGVAGVPDRLASPPATDTWAPMRTSEQVEQEADLAAALGLLAGARALLDDPAADRQDVAGLEAGGAQAVLGLRLERPTTSGTSTRSGPLLTRRTTVEPQGRLDPAPGSVPTACPVGRSSKTRSTPHPEVGGGQDVPRRPRPGCPATSGTWTFGLPALTTTVTTWSALSTVPASGRVAMTSPLATVRLVPGLLAELDLQRPPAGRWRRRPAAWSGRAG